jgi:hypothetical protein
MPTSGACPPGQGTRALVGHADFSRGSIPPAALLLERGVARHAQEPGGEGALAVLVAGDRGDQLREHVLGDVLGLVAVADDALEIALHVIGVADIEEVQGAHIALLGAGDRLVRSVPQSAAQELGESPSGRADRAGSRGLLGLGMVMGLVAPWTDFFRLLLEQIRAEHLGTAWTGYPPHDPSEKRSGALRNRMRGRRRPVAVLHGGRPASSSGRPARPPAGHRNGYRATAALATHCFDAPPRTARRSYSASRKGRRTGSPAPPTSRSPGSSG